MSDGTDPSDEAYVDASPFRLKPKDPLLARAVPVSQELPAYGGGHARRDVLAGVTVAALALPSAMAYAELEDLLEELRKDGIELSVARAKTPLTARLGEAGLSRIPLHATVRAAVKEAV